MAGAARWWTRRPLLADGLLALLLCALVALPVASLPGVGAREWAIVAGLTLPLTFRRRAPLAVFAALALIAFAQWLTGDVLLADAALLVALYTVAAYERRRWALPAALLTLEVGALLVSIDVAQRGVDSVAAGFLSLTAFAVAAAALGVYVRTRRDHIAALTARAAQLERERDQQAALAAAAERARIARELHDVVAHNLTVMVALADGVRAGGGADPGAADAAVAAVAATGREALGEMRRLVGVLREEGAGVDAQEGAAGSAEPGSTTAPLAPQPGLDQLDALVAQVRGAGLPTRLVRSGEPRPLGAGAQLTVYRLVQEALTNTLKHARAPSGAEVRLEWSAEALALEVSDDGAPAAGGAAVPGHGLAGMRERAALHRAEVEAGPRAGGGWRVRTRLPLERAS